MLGVIISFFFKSPLIFSIISVELHKRAILPSQESSSSSLGPFQIQEKKIIYVPLLTLLQKMDMPGLSFPGQGNISPPNRSKQIQMDLTKLPLTALSVN